MCVTRSLAPDPYAELHTQKCVGHRNYAAFVRFLLCVDVGIAMHLYMITSCAFGRALYTVRPHALQSRPS